MTSKIVNSSTPTTDTPGSESPKQIWSDSTLEFLEGLPRPWTRGLLYVFILFTSILIPWAMLAKVDETGTAQGRLEPKNRPIELDSQVVCTLVSIPQQEGEYVSFNQIIGECDTTLIDSDLSKYQQKLLTQNEQLLQLTNLLNQSQITYSTQIQQNQAQQLEKQTKIQQAQEQINSLIANFDLAKLEREKQLQQARNAIEVKVTDYQSALVRLETAQEKIPRYQEAYDNGVLSFEHLQEATQLEKERQQEVEQSKLEVQRAEIYYQEQENSYQKMQQEALAKIEEARLLLEQEQKSYQTLIYTNQLALGKITEQIKNIERDFILLKANLQETQAHIFYLEKQLEQYTFRSPVEGIIFNLPVKKPGSVIQSGELFASIAPQDSPLILRAEIPASDSGFIKLGQTVKLKFDAYPFQDYGVVEGKVNWISPTSKIQETIQGNLKVFELEIVIERPYINHKNGPIFLTPGQTATAEIVVRQRSVMDFVLEPFQKLQNTGLEL